MLFNSAPFLFLFLPLTAAGYFLLQSARRPDAARLFLLAACFVFYGWWDMRFVPLLAASILFNYYVGRRLALQPDHTTESHRLLVAGIILNLALLGLFKYYDFFVTNLNEVAGVHLPFAQFVLPLGISFFTFTQIAFLIDARQRKARDLDLANYSLFVTFFPHLIAGPIVHHSELMPQFADPGKRRLDLDNVARGSFIFALGLFKKVVVADTLAPWADQGFAATNLNFLEAWVAVLSYTFQIYFDFSGYCDMAIGASLIFNIKLPVNFLSPYRATDIQEFWRRWHMTLSRFLRDYLYVPLGGNRRGTARTYVNLIVVFLLGGFWHGAAWTFVIWGLLHGVALVIHRAWHGSGLALPRVLAWLVLFLFVNVTWVFFRAPDLATALDVLQGLMGGNGVVLPAQLQGPLSFLSPAGVEFGTYWFERIEWRSARFAFVFLPLCLVVVLTLPNSIVLTERFRVNWRHGLATALLVSLALAHLQKETPFLYYQF